MYIVSYPFKTYSTSYIIKNTQLRFCIFLLKLQNINGLCLTQSKYLFSAHVQVMIKNLLTLSLKCARALVVFIFSKTLLWRYLDMGEWQWWEYLMVASLTLRNRLPCSGLVKRLAIIFSSWQNWMPVLHRFTKHLT